MQNSLSDFLGSGSHPEEDLVDQKPDATSEAKKSKRIESKVSAPYPATPKSWLEFMKSERDFPPSASPALLNTSKSIKVKASESEKDTPAAQKIQEAPGHLPLPEIFPGFSMMPMMPLGMFPFPDSMFNLYWYPLMLPTQPPFIPSDNGTVPTPPGSTKDNNADETEEEDVDIIN